MPVPALYRVVHLALALAGVRLGVGAAGFGASLAAGADAAAAAVAVAVGLGGSLVGLVSSQRWALVDQPQVEELPADASRSGALGPALRSALMPSTVGASVLLVVALFFEPILAALLAGIVAGMGALALAAVVDVSVWERRNGRLLFSDRTRRRYAAPR